MTVRDSVLFEASLPLDPFFQTEGIWCHSCQANAHSFWWLSREKADGHRTGEGRPQAVFWETCQAELLSWAAHLRCLAVFGGSQVNGCWGVSPGHEAGAPHFLGSWWWNSDLWVFGESCCVIFSSFTEQGPCGVWSSGRCVASGSRFWKALTAEMVTAKLLWEERIKHRHRSSVKFWKSLTTGVMRALLWALRHVCTWSLAYLLSPACRHIFFFLLLWWHRKKRVEF